jgi:hypothetical protein
LVSPEYTVAGARYIAARPILAGKLPPDASVAGLDAALTWAREQTVAKIGPPPLAPNGKPDIHAFGHAGFYVRGTTDGAVFVVEGPPASNGQLPDWEAVRYRQTQPVEGEPGLVELLPEVANG